MRRRRSRSRRSSPVSSARAYSANSRTCTCVSPIEIVRRNVRFTLQPIDAPPGNAFARILDHIGCDELLLFSTDYPHWQFDGDAALPEALPGDLVRKIMIENPQQTYPRLEEAVR